MGTKEEMEEEKQEFPDRVLCSEYLWHIIWLAGAEAGQCLCADILGQEMGMLCEGNVRW